MKKLLLLLVIALVSNYSFSQTAMRMAPQPTHNVPEIRLNVYTLYAFDDKVDSYYSSTDYFEGTMKGGFQWGGGLEVMMDPETSMELSYLRLDSEAPMTYYANGVQNSTFDYASNYIMLGGNRYFGMNPKIEPYAGLQAGLAVINYENPDNGKSDTATKFAWGLKLGLNVWASDKVGLKIQTGLLSAVQAAGGGFYLGPGGGGAGVTTYSSVYQFNIGGGLTFSMGK